MEYETILSLSKKNLDNFRIIIVEFHNLREIKNKFFFKIVIATFEKLLENFIICHIHPNNSCGINSSNLKSITSFFDFIKYLS